MVIWVTGIPRKTVVGDNLCRNAVRQQRSFSGLQSPRGSFSIDLFSLYVLFSHFRPRDATGGNSFFQMSSYARANVRITNEKKQKENSMRHHVV